MRIAISGSSGLIGASLLASFTQEGDEVLRLVRPARGCGAGSICWDPEAGTIDGHALEGVDAVVHLAGESIAGGRWTSARKARILDSRVRSTRLIADALSHLAKPPAVLVTASAVGYYGDRGDEILTEESSPGTGFLSDVCRQWEEATRAAATAHIRTCHIRLGVVLSARGGALKQMLLAFRLGLGGRLGPGRQWMSWIALEDVVGAVRHVLSHPEIEGPANVVAPNVVSNADFTRALAAALHRPACFPVPAFALRLAMGEMATELLLSSARVVPRRLEQTRYVFRHPELGDALKAVFAR